MIFYFYKFCTFTYITNAMDDNFSPRVKDVITFSKEEALFDLGHDFIGTNI